MRRSFLVALAAVLAIAACDIPEEPTIDDYLLTGTDWQKAVVVCATPREGVLSPSLYHRWGTAVWQGSPTRHLEGSDKQCATYTLLPRHLGRGEEPYKKLTLSGRDRGKDIAQIDIFFKREGEIYRRTIKGGEVTVWLNFSGKMRSSHPESSELLADELGQGREVLERIRYVFNLPPPPRPGHETKQTCRYGTVAHMDYGPDHNPVRERALIKWDGETELFSADGQNLLAGIRVENCGDGIKPILPPVPWSL